MSTTLNGQHIPDALLTRSEVASWRTELAEIEAATAKLNARAAELGQLLNAAAVIERVRDMAGAAALDAANTPATLSTAIGGSGSLTATLSVVTPPASLSLAEAIRRVVNQADKPITPKMIRNAIAHSPDAGLIGSENYIYTAIARAAAKGEIIKTGDGYAPGPVS